MQRPSKEHIGLARAAYGWLRLSPILTIPTLALIVTMDIAQAICWEYASACYRQSSEGINYAIGVLGSAFWHLILLQV